MQLFNSVQVESDAETRGEQNPDTATGRRTKYLKSIGLNRDPFQLPVAEQEATFNTYLVNGSQSSFRKRDEPFSPLAYFVYPGKEETQTESELFDQLRSARPLVVLGKPGSGKTTLRLAMDALIRHEHSSTLSVSFSQLDHVLGTELEQEGKLDEDTYWLCLARDVTTDLFIQIIEQHDFYGEPPNQEQTRQLAQLFRFDDQSLWRLVDTLLELDETPDNDYGMGVHWREVARFPVRYVIWSPQLQEWLFQLRQQQEPRQKERVCGEATFCQALAAAKAWGFEQVIVLVDGVDNQSRQVANMQMLIRPLWESAAKWQPQGVVFKYFLTDELEYTIREEWIPAIEDEALRPRIIELTWTTEKLRELLRSRFRASGASIRAGFGDLVEPALGEQIDEMIIEQANGSPRELLQMVSALLDAYARYVPKALIGTDQEPLITRREWDYALRLFKLQKWSPASQPSST